MLDVKFDDDVFVNTDKNLLEIVCNNLISNALKLQNQMERFLFPVAKMNDTLQFVFKIQDAEFQMKLESIFLKNFIKVTLPIRNKEMDWVWP